MMIFENDGWRSLIFPQPDFNKEDNIEQEAFS